MTFKKFIKDLKTRKKEQIRLDKSEDLKKIIKNYRKKLPQNEFFENSLYIGPEIPSEVLEPVISDMGYCIIEQRDFFENFINYFFNRPSHQIILRDVL